MSAVSSPLYMRSSPTAPQQHTAGQHTGQEGSGLALPLNTKPKRVVKRVVLWIEGGGNEASHGNGSSDDGWADEEVLTAVAGLEHSTSTVAVAASHQPSATEPPSTAPMIGPLTVRLVHDLDEALEACAGTAAAKAICAVVANISCLPSSATVLGLSDPLHSIRAEVSRATGKLS